MPRHLPIDPSAIEERGLLRRHDGGSSSGRPVSGRPPSHREPTSLRPGDPWSLIDPWIDLVFSRTPRWVFALAAAVTLPSWWVVGDDIIGRGSLAKHLAEALGLSYLGAAALVCAGILVCNVSAFVYVMRPLFEDWAPGLEERARAGRG